MRISHLPADEIFRLLKLPEAVTGVGAAIGGLIRESKDLRAVLEMAQSVLEQGGTIRTRIAANGPTIGEVIERVLSTGSLQARK